LSGRGLCDELITRPEESYRLCCVVVCDLETSRKGAPYIYDISRLRVKRLGISPLPRKYEYTFSLKKLIGNNHQEIFRTISAVHSINTRTEHYFHKLPDFHVFKRVCTMLASTFPTVYLTFLRL